MRDGTSKSDGARAEAEADFRRALRDIFGGRCKAAWLSGSFLYKGAEPGRSDIDVVVVLEDDVPFPADDATLADIRAFVDAYLDIHGRHGLDPDLDFPGEYVVPATLDEAIAWRGFALDGGVIDRFPPVETKDYWLGRPDRWFHAWVSMTAFSRFLAGSRDYHEEIKLAAWKSIARFLLLRSGEGALTAETLLPGLAQFGAKPSYRSLWPLEREWLWRALGALEDDGVVIHRDGWIAPQIDALEQWQRQIAAAIAADHSEGPLLLPPRRHQIIEAHAAGRWSERESRLALVAGSPVP